jgi:hypothetical protein
MEVVSLKLLKLLVTATVMVCLASSAALAAPAQRDVRKVFAERDNCPDFQKDPIKALECKKEKVQSLLREGKITKEEAAEITARLDERIAKIKEFNKLTLPEKKAKLMEKHKAFIEMKVKEGTLSREKADAAIKEFNDRISKWDGKGFPVTHGGGMKEKKHPSEDKPIKPLQQ